MNYKILTIDQGTTSSRSITYDIYGGTIESSQHEYPLIYPEDGWVEIDPQVLMDSVIKSLNDINKDDIEKNLSFFKIFLYISILLSCPNFYMLTRNDWGPVALNLIISSFLYSLIFLKHNLI